MAFELQDRVARVSNLMSSRVDQEIVIMNIANSNYVALDEIGRRIWDLLEEPCLIDTLCQQLSREYQEDMEVVSADVLAFLDEMKDEGLVKSVS
jgi:hypothetical protein